VCARRKNGEVLCWGANGYGQIGKAVTVRSLAIPTKVAGIPTAIDVSIGAQACIVASSGKVWCWGRTTDGEIGGYATRMFPVPTPVVWPPVP
jgi:hypothetical protein